MLEELIHDGMSTHDYNQALIKALIYHYQWIALNYCNRTAVCSQLSHMGFRFDGDPAVPRKQLDMSYEHIRNEVEKLHRLRQPKKD